MRALFSRKKRDKFPQKTRQVEVKREEKRDKLRKKRDKLR